MFKFDNSYARLPELFYEKKHSNNSFKPLLLALNKNLADELGMKLENYSQQDLAEHFSANKFFPDSEPLAMAYAGHQFGHFVPQLGDGRALLLGEVLSPKNIRYDIHLKGSGQTKFSRRGDGKSALGPVVREYLMSECFHALGIPTTRSLCALRSGEVVYREEVKPGGILVRVAKSHIRIGTFEYFASRGDKENLKILADYAIRRLYPELSSSDNDYFSFWKAVAERQVKLIAKWMSVGFIHGVMNTDNINISGETIDFGPCAFMDEFKREKVFSSIDHNGRYRFNNQPQILFWNLARFAECLLLIMEGKEEILLQNFNDELQKLPQLFEKEYYQLFSKKLGLSISRDEDKKLIEEWLAFLELNELDFTLSHIDLERFYLKKYCFSDLNLRESFPKFFNNWSKRLESENNLESSLENMREHNPFTIARNHIVEKVIQNCEQGKDDLFFEFLETIKKPFDFSETVGEFQRAPMKQERVERTFCGT